MRRAVPTVQLALLAVVACGDQRNETQASPDDCTLRTIVSELVSSNAMDCSQEPDEGSGPAKIDCLNDAQAASRDAFWLSALTSGIDSLLQSAMIVRADGETLLLNYDSHPGGGGTGADTVYLSECPSFAVSRNLGCPSAMTSNPICSLGQRVN